MQRIVIIGAVCVLVSLYLLGPTHWLPYVLAAGSLFAATRPQSFAHGDKKRKRDTVGQENISSQTYSDEPFYGISQDPLSSSFPMLEPGLYDYGSALELSTEPSHQMIMADVIEYQNIDDFFKRHSWDANVVSAIINLYKSNNYKQSKRGAKTWGGKPFYFVYTSVP